MSAKGAVTRGASAMRVTFMWKSNVTSAGSTRPVIGAAERESLVRPYFEKLRLYGLTIADLATALRVANVNFPGGRIRKGPLYLPLRILGEFESLEEMRRTEIPAAGPGPAARQ